MPVQDIAPPVVALGAEGETIELGGSKIVFKSPAPGSPDAWTVIDYTMAPEQPGPPLHYHQGTTESFYVISGELWMRVGDREFTAGPGSLAFVPPGTLHAFANRSGKPVHFLGHASTPGLRDLILEQIALFRAGNWPPTPEALREFGLRHDTHYL
jgi:mannose-6-phosphate isomerase-like protein (cupin superfamily)